MSMMPRACTRQGTWICIICVSHERRPRDHPLAWRTLFSATIFSYLVFSEWPLPGPRVSLANPGTWEQAMLCAVSLLSSPLSTLSPVTHGVGNSSLCLCPHLPSGSICSLSGPQEGVARLMFRVLGNLCPSHPVVFHPLTSPSHFLVHVYLWQVMVSVCRTGGHHR